MHIATGFLINDGTDAAAQIVVASDPNALNGGAGVVAQAGSIAQAADGGLWVNTDGTGTGWVQVSMGIEKGVQAFAEAEQTLSVVFGVAKADALYTVLLDETESSLGNRYSAVTINKAIGGFDIKLDSPIAAGDTLNVGYVVIP